MRISPEGGEETYLSNIERRHRLDGRTGPQEGHLAGSIAYAYQKQRASQPSLGTAHGDTLHRGARHSLKASPSGARWRGPRAAAGPAARRGGAARTAGDAAVTVM